MSRPADDPSVGRSAGTAVGRAVVLLVVAVVLGLVLLNGTGDREPQRVTTDVVSDDADGGGDGDELDEVTTTVPPTTAVPARPAEQVKVLAANATTSKGVAGKLTQTLKSLGYNALAPVDAPPTRETVVYYAAGFEREAAELARVLALGEAAVKALTTPAPVKDLRAANLVVIVGSDYAQRVASEDADVTASSTTSTTARRAAGSTTTTTR